MNYFDIEKINVTDGQDKNGKTIDGISVIIPLYNGIEFLEQSVGSVISQTYKSWQLIIGINGYKKGSDVEIEANNIINKLDANRVFDISVIYFDTNGKSKTMNAMVKHCKYNYVAILDADDYWVNDKLELQIPFLIDYDVVGGKCEYFGDKSGSPPIPLGDFTSKHNIFDYNPIINSSAIIRKKDALWDDEKYVKPLDLEDYSLWFKLYFLKRKFYNIDKVLCYHRIHNLSSFNTNNDNNVNELKQLWYHFYHPH